MLKFLSGKKKSVKTPPSIVICSTMRSGSTMICEDMRNTRSLGTARELFMNWRPGKADKYKELEKLFEEEVTENGVFSVKVMSRYLPHTEAALQGTREDRPEEGLFPYFHDVFKDATWVYLKRNDILGQAISRYISNKTGVYHNFDDGRHSKSKTVLKAKGESYSDDLDYKFLPINKGVQNIAREQVLWEHFFTTQGIEPVRLTYEDCVEDHHTYLQAIANVAGIKLEKMPAERTIKRLPNKRNDELREEYCRDLARRIRNGTFVPGQKKPNKSGKAKTAPGNAGA
ncbi:LPS sulfotransferase NodH [Kordiimonas lacus]|uniref:LPS sulfotransferase NodH n=2 Tax=Kordiimonas lacus TaxID=637679 RepID=A0A1G7E900_9PROT|nr:LPS sulfotransferase NodH [Kordiimonas lacus]